jgi:uncharacterized phage-associated protein
MSKRYPTGAVVNWFLRQADKERKHLTATKLQCLVFLAHLGYGGRLVDEPAEAWATGVIFPSIYHEYTRRYGNSSIPFGSIMHELDLSLDKPQFKADFVDANDSKVLAHLSSVWEAQAGKSEEALYNEIYDSNKLSGKIWTSARYNADVQKLRHVDISQDLYQLAI